VNKRTETIQGIETFQLSLLPSLLPSRLGADPEPLFIFLVRVKLERSVLPFLTKLTINDLLKTFLSGSVVELFLLSDRRGRQPTSVVASRMVARLK
jgi:hypothetical protein